MIPIEIGMPTYQVQHFDPNLNNERLKENLDLLEERREEAVVHTTNNKRKVEQYFNKRVKPRFFKVEELVLK